MSESTTLREAVAGAFAQTYENLEFMREMTAQCTSPHKVIIKRMETQCLLPATNTNWKMFTKWEMNMWRGRRHRMWRLWR